MDINIGNSGPQSHEPPVKHRYPPVAGGAMVQSTALGPLHWCGKSYRTASHGCSAVCLHLLKMPLPHSFSWLHFIGHLTKFPRDPHVGCFPAFDVTVLPQTLWTYVFMSTHKCVCSMHFYKYNCRYVNFKIFIGKVSSHDNYSPTVGHTYFS